MKFTELFQRKNKDDTDHASPRIITFACPNCGKEHSVQYRQIQKYYLDGMPKDLESALAMVVVCDCGCVCREGMWSWNTLSQTIASPEYQAVLNGAYSDIERKLRLMTFFALFFPYAASCLTHAVIDSEKPDAIAKAITRVSTLETEFAPFVFYFEVPGTRLPHFSFTQSFGFSSNLHLIDLYRRAGDFQSASLLIQRAHEHKSAQIEQYLKFQQKLIDKKCVSEQ